MSAEERARLVAAKEHVRRQLPRVVSAGGRLYAVRQVSKAVRARINALELEAFALSGRQKEPMPLKKAKAIQRKLDVLHAKTAAYYLLGNRALFFPPAFAFTWRRLMLRPEEVIAAINDAAVNDEEVGFYLANWENTKRQLALSMRPIGQGVELMLQRWEAAASQASRDATAKEGRPSGVSSGKARTAKR